MAKLKPIKDEKELAAVPLDEPVLVELEPAATGAEVEQEPDRREDDKPLAADNKDADGASELQRQLEAATEASRIDRERADTAEREAKTAREERDRLRTDNADTEKELLSSSLSAAQADVAAAKAAYKTAFEAGDPDAMADAQEKIGRSAAKVLNYEGAIAQFETDAKVTKEEPDTDRPAPKVDIMTAIDRDPNLFPKERVWLKEHPEVLTDTSLNQDLSVGYKRAIAKGFKRGTDGYFKFLDEFMGYSKPQREEQDDDTDNSGEGASIVSAPVTRDSRSSMSGKPVTPTRIHLSPEQRQLARDMGISDAAYARGVQKLDANKKADPERFSGRQ